MEHVTALVDHDATTRFVCGCQRYVDAGWSVTCDACGRGKDGLIPDEVVNALDLAVADTQDRIRHRADRIRVAAGDGWLLEDFGDEDERWSSIEPYDVERDDRLADEAA